MPPFFPDDHHAENLRGRPMNMTRSQFQRHIQGMLVEFCALPLQDAKTYTTQGIRAGAATTLVKHRVPDHVVKGRAGVTSDDWIMTYDRIDLDRRLECSRALSL